MDDNLRDTALRQAAACAREKYAGEEKQDRARPTAGPQCNAVTLQSWTGTEPSVRSDRDPEVFYHVASWALRVP